MLLLCADDLLIDHVYRSSHVVCVCCWFKRSGETSGRTGAWPAEELWRGGVGNCAHTGRSQTLWYRRTDTCNLIDRSTEALSEPSFKSTGVRTLPAGSGSRAESWFVGEPRSTSLQVSEPTWISVPCAESLQEERSPTREQVLLSTVSPTAWFRPDGPAACDHLMEQHADHIVCLDTNRVFNHIVFSLQTQLLYLITVLKVLLRYLGLNKHIN